MISGGRITAALTGYAYETIPGKAIIAGQTKGPDEIDNSPDQLNPTALNVPALSSAHTRHVSDGSAWVVYLAARIASALCRKAAGVVAPLSAVIVALTFIRAHVAADAVVLLVRARFAALIRIQQTPLSVGAAIRDLYGTMRAIQ